MVEIVDSESTRQSVFLRGLAGSKLPVAVAHAEGRAYYLDPSLEATGAALRYVDGQGLPASTYPLNPNGSFASIAGVQSADGRALALMPHPERVVATHSLSWASKDILDSWDTSGPWFRMFQNAYTWCQANS